MNTVFSSHSWALGLQIRQKLSSLGPILATPHFVNADRRPKSDRLPEKKGAGVTSAFAILPLGLRLAQLLRRCRVSRVLMKTVVVPVFE